MNYLGDTIAAISTPPGRGGIGVVRLSGLKAVEIADKIFRGNQSLFTVPTHSIHHGYIYDDGKLIDEAMVSVMRAPHSYTKQDIVEISGHGGPLVVNHILKTVLNSGARLAYPGEFTERAFLSGRLDLTQAEAIREIIEARTGTGLAQALNQLGGNLSQTISQIRSDLFSLLTHLEATLDFPEAEIEPPGKEQVSESLGRILTAVEKLLKTFPRGRMITEGVTISIVGKPNVGKSSLLNALVEKEKAIVTPSPGTTRDLVEDWIDISGVPVRFTDTAGIKHPETNIEEISIARSINSLESADCALFVLDISSPLDERDRQIARQISNRRSITVANKIDLPLIADKSSIQTLLPDKEIIYTSAIKLQGIQDLKKALSELFSNGSEALPESPVVTSLRHQQLLEKVARSLGEALKNVREGKTEEFICLGLRQACRPLDEILGIRVPPDILGGIFSRFCIGK